MLRNYITVAFRIFRKNAAYSFINIAGLTLGIATCLFILLYVLDELSYDQYHEKADRIYRLTEVLHLPKEDRHQTLTAPPMGPALQQNFPEVLATTRLDQSRRTLQYGDKKFYDTRIWYSDPAFFEIFSYPLISGNPKTALVEPYSIVLTETAARRFFGNEEALGKTLVFSDTMPVVVTGVIRDVPENSHIRFDVMLSRATWTAILNGEPEDNWFDNGYSTYVLLAPGSDVQNLEKKFGAYARKVMSAETTATGMSYDFILQPLTDIHLRSRGIMYSNPTDGDIRYVYIFSSVGLLVLLVACANYINLSTARAVRRGREVGMRKVIGARRPQLIMQMMGESFALTAISMLLAMTLVVALLPQMQEVTGKNLTAAYLLDGNVILILLAMFTSVTLLAGAYPAVLMSAFSPIEALKSRATAFSGSGMLRRGLVVFQFSISIIMIAMTVLVFEQMQFIRQKDLGLQKDQVVFIPFRPSVVFEVPTIKNEILREPGVVSASSTNFSYTERASSIAMVPRGAENGQATSINVISVDEDFLPTLGLKLIAGQNLFPRRRDFEPGDSTSVIIVNETAVKQFGWGTPEEALSQTIRIGDGDVRVAGVVGDFNFHSLHEPIAPLVIFNEFMWQNHIAVKIEPAGISETIRGIEQRWKGLGLDSPFSYTFMDVAFENLYQEELRLQTIITFLSTLSVFIASLGLFGLVSFMAEQRMKEIGVRKVLGASVPSLVALLSRDFLKLLLVSTVIALPLSWFAMNRWIGAFAFQVDVSAWILVLAAAACSLIALITVALQGAKAASADPVKTLRTE